VNDSSVTNEIVRLSRWIVGAALLALALLYVLWFHADAHRGAAMVIFVLPPLLLLLLLLAGRTKAALWAGIFALFWFSHAVMLAFSEPAQRYWAYVAIVLALVIVFSSSLPGLYARFVRH